MVCYCLMIRDRTCPESRLEFINAFTNFLEDMVKRGVIKGYRLDFAEAYPVVAQRGFEEESEEG